MAFAFEKLVVYQKSVNFADAICQRTEGFSRGYGFLVDQLNRAALSIAANIAEGHGRESTGTFIQFLRIAQGSLKELETHVVVSGRVGLLADTMVSRLLNQAEEIGRMLRSLIRSLQQKS